MNKIKEILDVLATLQENLLSLPDDMLLSINPRDNESLDRGYQFIKSFNENMNQFTDSASKIEAQIKAHFEMNPEEEDVEKESSDVQRRERIVKELDRTAPHYLNEDFTYKRPYGFILGDSAYKGIKTWKNLYLHVLKDLQEKFPEKFSRLPEEEKFISSRGNKIFARDKTVLRLAEELENGVYAEVNLSANHIRNNIRDLFDYFKVGSKIKIYLREDRDAAEEG